MTKSSFHFLACIILLSIASSCGKSERVEVRYPKGFTWSSFDIQGHRGARGLVPENSIPGMLKALELGVTTLELDVVVTKDKEIILSHEPFMNPMICLDRNGQELFDADTVNIYQIDYDEVRRYDCGTKAHPGFPDQEKLSIKKPLLSEVFGVVEKHIANQNKTPVYYNIEIKSQPATDGLYHPEVEEFTDLLMELINEFELEDRVFLQSFDFRVLQYARTAYPKLRLVALVENHRSVEQNLKQLGFLPYIYAPYYKRLDRASLEKLQQRGVKVIPWTINDQKDMAALIEMGVDGIITDYPDRLIALKKQSE